MFMCCTFVINAHNHKHHNKHHGHKYELYATKYHAGVGCGYVTASGDRIDTRKVQTFEIRWVALSREMFTKHGFKMGDKIKVHAPNNPMIDGTIWIVKDKMGASKHNAIDFLTTKQNSKSFKNGMITIEKIE